MQTKTFEHWLTSRGWKRNVSLFTTSGEEWRHERHKGFAGNMAAAIVTEMADELASGTPQGCHRR